MNGHDLTLDRSVRAVLVRKGGGAGAVRVTGSTFINELTGPDQRTGFVIIVVGPYDDCILFGSPSVRCFRQPS